MRFQGERLDGKIGKRAEPARVRYGRAGRPIMTSLVDCPSCGSLMPVERRCCPHCHCRTTRWRRWVLLASAALGLGAPGCTNSPSPPVTHYGVSMMQGDGGTDGGADHADREPRADEDDSDVRP